MELTTLKSNMLAKVFTDKTSSRFRPAEDMGMEGGGGAGGGCGLKNEASTELRRFSENIGVVGTEVVEDTDEDTDPPVPEVLRSSNRLLLVRICMGNCAKL